MAAVIANEFTEATDDLYLSALIEIGLVLFVVTLVINALSRLLVWSVTREVKVKRSRPRAASPRLPGAPLNRDGAAAALVGHRRLAVRRRGASWRWFRWCSSSSTSSSRAFSALNWDFFTKMPKPVGEAGGGMANAIVGTLILIGHRRGPRGAGRDHRRASTCRSTRKRPFATLVRFTADVLNGVPSIVIGIFAYGLVVLPVKHFSALAGGLALGVMMIPIITRTTEELLEPRARHACARRRWRSAPRARARPSRWWCRRRCRASSPASSWRSRASRGRRRRCSSPPSATASSRRALDQPIASLPVQIYTYAISPYEDWHRQAWAGALVLVGARLHLLVLARVVTRRLERMHRT